MKWFLRLFISSPAIFLWKKYRILVLQIIMWIIQPESGRKRLAEYLLMHANSSLRVIR